MAVTLATGLQIQRLLAPRKAPALHFALVQAASSLKAGMATCVPAAPAHSHTAMGAAGKQWAAGEEEAWMTQMAWRGVGPSVFRFTELESMHVLAKGHGSKHERRRQ